MKRLIILLSLVAAAWVRGQSTNAPATTPIVTNAAPALTAQGLEAQTAERFQRTFVFRETKPNEIAKGNITYSGIAIEAAKKPNPLQLFNPFAPVDYGSPEDNLVRDPINGKATGLKLFAIRF